MQRNNKTAMITHFTTVLLITVLMLLQTIEGRSSVLYLIVMTVVGLDVYKRQLYVWMGLGSQAP